jgi:hypothetical protein
MKAAPATETAPTVKTIEQLEHALAALPDPLDVPPRQFDEVETRRSALRACIYTIRSAKSELADVDPQLAAFTKWHDHLVSWRKTLCDQLVACPPQARIGIELSIKRIDRGLDLMGELLPGNLPLDDLMRDAGYVPRDAVARAHGEAWLGTLPYVEQRLAELQRRRDDTQARLNADVREQEQRSAPKSAS